MDALKIVVFFLVTLSCASTDRTCGEHEEAISVAGFTICYCTEGYHRNRDRLCVPNQTTMQTKPTMAPSTTTTTTEKYNECGEHGIAVNIGGLITCDCEEGYEFNDDFECRPLQSIATTKPVTSTTKPTTMIDAGGVCGVHGELINLGGLSTCACDSGFYGMHCEIEDPCASKKCGLNAKCIPPTIDGESAVCRCEVGYHDSGNGRCKPKRPKPNNGTTIPFCKTNQATGMEPNVAAVVVALWNLICKGQRTS